MLDNMIYLKNLTCQLLFNHDLGFIWMGEKKRVERRRDEVKWERCRRGRKSFLPRFGTHREIIIIIIIIIIG